MAYGQAEDPARSVTAHLDADYPVSRDELVLTAEDNGAPAEIINLLKSLPREEYETREMVFRDLGEASRRSAAGPTYYEDELRDRRNIARDHFEGTEGPGSRHP